MLLAVYDSLSQAEEFLKLPHDEKSCPRSWYDNMFNFRTEEQSTLLTGSGVVHIDNATYKKTEHDTKIVRMRLSGQPVIGNELVWITYAWTPYLGDLFESAISQAFTNKELALAHIGLPHTAEPPTQKSLKDGSAHKSPYEDYIFDGDASIYMRAYLCESWRVPVAHSDF